MLTFSTGEDIKQPKGGVILDDVDEKDHILGGLLSGEEWEVLVKDGQWMNYIPDYELQRNRFGDLFGCVSFSLNNVHEMILKKRYDETVNKSDLFLMKISGTIQGQGNSVRAVAESNRLKGWVTEGRYPYTSEMTVSEAYRELTNDLLMEGKKGLDLYTFRWKWLNDNSTKSLKEGLTFSPIQVTILGSYLENKKGYIIFDRNHPEYTHEVCIFGYEDGECWYVYDSENEQYLKFAWNYAFRSPAIHSVTKNMKIEIYKKKGQSGLAVKTYGEPSMIFFSGGDITAQTLFFSIYGVTDWKQIPIKEVNEFPFPPKHIFNSNPYKNQ